MESSSPTSIKRLVFIMELLIFRSSLGRNLLIVKHTLVIEIHLYKFDFSESKTKTELLL